MHQDLSRNSESEILVFALTTFNRLIHPVCSILVPLPSKAPSLSSPRQDPTASEYPISMTSLPESLEGTERSCDWKPNLVHYDALLGAR